MSTPANITNDSVGDSSARQPATGASNLLLPVDNAAARETLRQQGSGERSHENTSLPISDREPSRIVASPNSTRTRRRSITCADGEHSEIEANTNSKRARREGDALPDEEAIRSVANTVSTSARRTSATLPDEEATRIETNTNSTTESRRKCAHPVRCEDYTISIRASKSITHPGEEPSRIEAEANTISTRARSSGTLPDGEPSRTEADTNYIRASRRSSSQPDVELRRSDTEASTFSTRARSRGTLPDGEPRRIEANTDSIRARRRSSTDPNVEPSRSEGNTISTRARTRSGTLPGEQPNGIEAGTNSMRARRKSRTLPDGEPRRSEANTNSTRARRRSVTHPGEEPNRSEANTTSTRARRRSVTNPGEEPNRNEANTTSTRATSSAAHANNGVNRPLLSNLENHPSARSRAGDGPSLRNLNLRGAWPKAHALYHKAHDQYKELFAAAGFGDFLMIQPKTLPQTYTVALMERWFSDTNTLHLPCGEIGPTPVDWTMVTGLRFEGRTIKFSRNFSMDRALELLGARRNAISEGKIKLSVITPSEEEVRAEPPSNEAKKKVFRRLFLYVIASCFFGNNRSVIKYELVKCLENINQVRRYNWGAITYAAFIYGMRRKVSGLTGAFTGFWQFLPFWAFEYLDISRPIHTEEDVFPRARRWNCPRGEQEIDHNFAELIGARCQLDYVEEAHVNWQPYLQTEVYDSDFMIDTRALAKRRVPFKSIETWEYYLGERCRRQLGWSCRVPLPPPEDMYGTYQDIPDDVVGVGRSTETLVMDDTVDYAQWFAANSIGRIANVNRCIGGAETGLKVANNWLANYHPDLMIIPRSEFNELVKARDQAVDENLALRVALDLEREDPVERDDPAEAVNNIPEQGMNDHNIMQQNDSEGHD